MPEPIPHALAVKCCNAITRGVVADRTLAELIDRTCRVSEREALLAECREAMRSLWDMFAVPGGVGVLHIDDSVRRLHAMRLEALLARLDARDTP